MEKTTGYISHFFLEKTICSQSKAPKGRIVKMIG